jgi:hypothetical protein
MRSIATFIKQVTGTRAPSKTKLVTPIISAPSVSSLYSLLSDTSQCGSPGGQPGWEFIYAGDSEVYDKWVCYPTAQLFLSSNALFRASQLDTKT